MRRALSIGVVVGAAATLTALGDATPTGPFNEVAEFGLPAAGLPAGRTYGAVQTPLLDSTGTFLFASEIDGEPSVSGMRNGGIFLGHRGALQFVARAGDAAPGAEGAVWSDVIGGALLLRAGGRVAFPAELLGADAAHNGGVWAGTAGNLSLVAREGDAAPGTTAVYAAGAVDNFFQNGLHLAMNDAGTAALRAKLSGTGVTAANNEAIFVGAPGALALVARLGSAAPDAGGATFASDGSENFSTPSIFTSGKLLFRGHLAGTGVTGANADGIWYGDPSSLALVVRGGQAVSGPGIPANSTLLGLGTERPVGNDAGQLLFESITYNGSAFVEALFLGLPASLAPIAVQGAAAPDDSHAATFAGSFFQKRLNAQGQAVFRASLSTSGADFGLYGWDGSTLRRLQRTGDQAPGMPAGQSFSGLNTEDVFLNSAGKVLFRDTTRPSFASGIWLADLTTGDVQLVASSGVTATVAGSPRQFIDVSLFSGWDTAGSTTDGRSSPLGDDGTYAFAAQFVDGHIAALTNPGGASGGAGAAYLLPISVKAKANAKHPERSTLVASGILNTGPDAPDFSGAATLDVGGFHLDIPAFVAKGKSRAFSANGITLTLTPAANGSSRTAFGVKIVGDLAGKVDLAGPLAFEFKNALYDARGSVDLAAGAPAPHGIVAPNLSVLATSATRKGAGKDKFALVLAFATDGVAPAAASDLTIGFGDTFETTIPAADFNLKHNAYVLASKSGGITKATIDYSKGTVTIAGSALDLGAFPAGGDPVTVTISLGADVRTAVVRMSSNGVKLAY